MYAPLMGSVNFISNNRTLVAHFYKNRCFVNCVQSDFVYCQCRCSALYQTIEEFVIRMVMDKKNSMQSKSSRQ